MERFVASAEGASAELALPGGSLSLRHSGGGWDIEYRPSAGAGGTKASSLRVLGAAGLWLRWRLPSRPCMLAFGRPLILAPEAKALLAFTVPLSLSVEDEAGRPYLEIDDPAARRAWYGPVDTGSGEASEALFLSADPRSAGSAAEAAVPYAESGPPLAGVPVILRNETRRSIELPRVTLPVRLLRLWRMGASLVSDEVTVTYEPDDDIRVTTGNLGSSLPGLELKRPPRDTRTEFLLQKGMRLLRGLAGWEGR